MLVQCGKILLFLAGAALCEAWPPPTTVVSVLDGLRLRYNWNCNYLLRERLNTTKLAPDLALHIQKEASLVGLQVAAMEYKTFLQKNTREKLECKSEALIVFIYEGKATMDFLLKVENGTEAKLPSPGYRIMLLFAKENLFEGSFFDNINIPFHRQFILAFKKGNGIELVEGYRVGSDWPMIVAAFGVWNKGQLTSTDKTLYNRRDDLMGFEFKAVFIETPPFSPIVTTPQGVRPGGLIGNVWSVLAKQMNCSTIYQFRPPPDNSEFTLNNQLRKNATAHVGLFPYVVTLWWLKNVEFSVPMFESSSFIYLRMPESLGTRWGNYLEPFSPPLWQTLLATVVVTTVTLLVLQSSSAVFGDDRSEPRPWSFWQTLQFVIGAFSAQGHESTPQSSGSRLAFLTTFLTALVMTSAYSAKLISFLAVQTIEIPFTKPEDFIENDVYSFGFTWANSESMIFKGTLGYWGEVFNRTRHKNHTEITTPLPLTSLEGFVRSCEEKYGHMALRYVASHYENAIPCQLMTLPNFDMHVSLSLTFEKDSPYKGLVNHNLRKMRRSGILKRLVSKYWPEERPLEEKLLAHVELGIIRPILAFLCVFGFVCSIVLLMERLTNTVLKRKGNRLTRAK